MNRVIITGATSMIGQAVVEECLEQGKQVCAVIRKDTKRRERLPQHLNLSVVECSLEEMRSLPEKISGSWDTFYHIAWGSTGENRNKSVILQSKNIEYTMDAAWAAKRTGLYPFYRSRFSGGVRSFRPGKNRTGHSGESCNALWGEQAGCWKTFPDLLPGIGDGMDLVPDFQCIRNLR